MEPIIKEKNISRLFEISLILKSLAATAEIVGGLVLIFISKVEIITYVLNLLQNELTDNPKDLIASFIVNIAASFAVSSQYSFAIYLLINGLIKVFIVVSLLKRKLWAYPTAIVVFSLLVFYQSYGFYMTGSLWLFALIILDIIVILLTIHEYKVKSLAIKTYKQNFESIMKD